MYNEQLKMKFVTAYSEKKTSQRLVKQIMSSLEPYELEFGRDFSLFDDEQCSICVNAAAGLRSGNAKGVHNILKKYVGWCQLQGMETSESVFSVHLDSTQRKKTCMVANPQHLLITLNTVFPDPDVHEIDYIYRALFWLGFIGLDDMEAIAVKQSEVNFEEMRIYFSGNPHPYAIYPEAVRDLRKAVSLRSFAEPRCGTLIYKDRMNGEEILRGKMPQKDMRTYLVSTVRPRICKAFAQAKERAKSLDPDGRNPAALDLSFHLTYLSGICYRAYEYERIGIPLDFVGVVEHEFANISPDDKRFSGRNFSYIKKRNAAITWYMKDYESWKKAFSPK